jgi:hypothetical protein
MSRSGDCECGDAPGRSQADEINDLIPKSIGLGPFDKPVEIPIALLQRLTEALCYAT